MKTRSFLLLPTAALALNAASAVQVHGAAVDYFLKIDGIQGESADAKHKGEIQLTSFSWGATNTGTQSHGSGGGAGKVLHKPLVFTSEASKTTPKLFLACATGQHYKEAELDIVTTNADGAQSEFLKIHLTDVLISSFLEGGNGGGVPVDSVSLNFTKIAVSSDQQKVTPIDVLPPETTDLAGN